MKASELRSMTREELHHEMAELREEEFRLRLRRATEDLPNALRIRTIRRDISRIQTVLREDKLGIIKLPSKSEKKDDKIAEEAKKPEAKKTSAKAGTKKKKPTTKPKSSTNAKTTKTSKSKSDKKTGSKTVKEKE